MLGSCQAVVRQSSGSHQAVIRQSSGSLQAVIRHRQAVVRQSSGSCQAVVRQSSQYNNQWTIIFAVHDYYKNISMYFFILHSFSKVSKSYELSVSFVFHTFSKFSLDIEVSQTHVYCLMSLHRFCDKYQEEFPMVLEKIILMQVQ